jgi:deazaflavin-dependent oxidoreductase (nitroreductase family)
MADTAPGEASDFNTKIIEEFRANRGRVGGPLASTQMILIHHTGAKSGTVRVTPLACNPQPDRRLAIVASNGGSPAHPDWYYNLKANPHYHCRGGYPDVHGTGGRTRRHRLGRAVAEAGRAVSCRRRTPGQDHATDSGFHAHPPGLTCDQMRICAWRGRTDYPIRLLVDGQPNHQDHRTYRRYARPAQVQGRSRAVKGAARRCDADRFGAAGTVG